MIRGALLFLILYVSAGILYAQDPVLSGNPGSVKWDQILTPSFQIIFPSGYEQKAHHIANTLEHLKYQEAETMSESMPRRIPIILNHYQSISNAFVGMGPWRSEFNLMPSPQPELLGTNQWDELIAAHEYRHVVQFHHSRRGFNKLLYYVFGQQTQAGMAFAAVPRWFWEGDATLTETLYTPSGRGRIPAFSRVFRTNLLEQKRYSYNKQHLRSYRDFVPDHYKLGYYFVTYIRRRSRDPEIWEKITGDAYGQSIIPFTFSNAMKRHTGQFLVPTYERMMDELFDEWKQQQESREIIDPEYVSRRLETTYTDFLYPAELGDGRVVAMKTGIGDITQFVSFNSQGYGERIFIPGIINDAGMLSARGSKIVFNEFEFDPRWRNRTYSVIKLYDTATGRVKSLSSRSRFNGADLAPDERKIVTSETTSDQTNRLVVIDALSGARIGALPNPSNGLYIMPRWSEDGNSIVSVKLEKTGKTIVLVDFPEGRETVLWDAGRENIGHAVFYDSLVYYNSPKTGIDNIFALELSTGMRYQVTESRYGAYNPMISSKGQLIFNEHRLNGMDVVQMPIKRENWMPVTDSIPSLPEYFEPVMDQEGRNMLTDVPNKDYPVSKYSKAAHMFNVHSWGPLASTDLNSIEVGIASRDVLNTTQLTAGYRYDLSEETGNVYANLSYQDLYPIIDAGVEFGSRISDRGSVVNSGDIRFTWDETTVYGGIRIPFLLTRSKMLSEFTISNRVGLTSITKFKNSQIDPTDSSFSERYVPIRRGPQDSLALFFTDELNDGTLISNNLSLTYYALLKRSPRDINSQYGIILNGRWLSTPFGGDFSARTYAARAILYLPSPLSLTGSTWFKHHSLYFSAAWQSSEREAGQDLYVFRNQIPRPRGYAYPQFPDFYYAGVNYTFPVWYPDVSAGPVLFLKRLRTNLFFDYGKGTRQNYLYDFKNEINFVTAEDIRIYRSVGLEANIDLHVMRFPQEFGIGVRYSRLLSTDGNSFDLLLSIDF